MAYLEYRRPQAEGRMKKRTPEQMLQIAVAQYLELALPTDAVFTAINPIPAKSKAAAGLSKVMGLKPGIPDILITWRGAPYLIELKAKRGKVSDAQLTMINRLSSAGASCAVCHSAEAVMGHLIEWGFPLKARL